MAAARCCAGRRSCACRLRRLHLASCQAEKLGARGSGRRAALSLGTGGVRSGDCGLFYDFARDLFFQDIGASGFAMGAIQIAKPPDSGGFGLRYAAFMQGLRDAIDARIRTRLDGDERAIATALLTGRRDAITEPVNDAMFISGLGHVLSISGYHRKYRLLLPA
jgi:predicted membrane metal-binding protein